MRHGLCAGVPAGAAVDNAPADGFAVHARPRTIHDARRRTPLTNRLRDTVAVARSLVARFSCHAFVSAGYGGGEYAVVYRRFDNVGQFVAEVVNLPPVRE